MNAKPTKPAAQAEANSASAGTDPLFAKLKAIEARAIERSKRRRAQESLPFSPEAKAEPAIPEQTAQLIEFPQWPDDRRATAQAVFRSALFPAIGFKGGRPFLKEERLCSVEGVEVFFTGERFDQSDLDVYLELLKIARQSPFGAECRFSAYSLLKALGRQTGNKDHKWLHSVIVRLRSGTVDMTDHRARYFGGLVDGGTQEEDSRRYKVRINTDFACFFKAGLWASLDSRQRYALGRNQARRPGCRSTGGSAARHSTRDKGRFVPASAAANRRPCSSGPGSRNNRDSAGIGPASAGRPWPAGTRAPRWRACAAPSPSCGNRNAWRPA